MGRDLLSHINHGKIFHSVVRIVKVSVLLFLSCTFTHGSSTDTDFPVPENSERIYLSLRVLSEHVSKAIVDSRSIPDECQNLAKIGYLEGYIVDEGVPNDVILFGLRSKERPSLRLDDLIVNMRSLGIKGKYPYCSLDPRRENTVDVRRLFKSSSGIQSKQQMKNFFMKLKKAVGPQQVVVGGVPNTSRHAHVMINADYHMKKVSQGHILLGGVSSYLDHSLKEAKEKIIIGEKKSASEVNMARFWFHIGDGSPTFLESNDIIWLEKCDVVVLTEKQNATASGILIDVVDDDRNALAFANEISIAFKEVTKHFPVYAELENLFRLRALLLSLEFKNSFSASGWSSLSFIPIELRAWFMTLGSKSPSSILKWNMPLFIPNYTRTDDKPMEPNKPGLANFKNFTYEVSEGRKIYQFDFFSMVCGGVGMDMEIDKKNYKDNRAARLSAFRHAALVARKLKSDLWWKVAE